MELGAANYWWLTAGALVAAELATGTFYLLMLAVGPAVAALVAHMGLGLQAQMLLAALAGGGAVIAWHLRRGRARPAPPPEANRDINLDIGSHVQVRHWSADGTARVPYRGSTWSVRYAGSGSPQPGTHVIRAIEGSQLVLERAAD